MHSIRALRLLGQRQEKLRRRELDLLRREAKLRAERNALRAVSRKLGREAEKQRALHAELEAMIASLDRKELERRVQAEGGGVAFAMYPTTIDDLMAIADAGAIMPPKSTWFEPKLRSGLFVHQV